LVNQFVDTIGNVLYKQLKQSRHMDQSGTRTVQALDGQMRQDIPPDAGH